MDVSSPRIDGNINMSASTGKLALAKKVEGLTGNCPIDDPMMVDFIGYGTADCFEGGQTAPNPGNNATALIRTANADTDQNTIDFAKATPNPRGSGTLVDLPPFLTAKDPVGADAPLDASVTINFSEPVTVSGSWYNINCVTSGVHSSTQVAVAFAGAAYVITPNVAFTPGETCIGRRLRQPGHRSERRSTDDAGRRRMDLHGHDGLPDRDRRRPIWPWAIRRMHRQPIQTTT